MNKDNLLIKNVRIINPATHSDYIGCIAIQNGIITELIEGKCDDSTISSFSDNEIIDGTNLVAAPGLIDIHVHFRDPGFTYKEDIATGSMAAAKGGFTSVIMMANTSPTVDNEQVLSEVLNKGNSTDINVYATSAVTMGLKGEKLCDFSLMVDKGASGFTDDGIPIMNEELLREAMTEAARLDMPISLHEEDPSIIVNPGVNSGEVAKKLGIVGAPREAEYTLIDRDIRIGIETKAKVNIQHISSKEGVELVRKARKIHDNIHAEATPHHFTLTQEAVLKYGTLAKMNPPLRLEEDRLAIIEGLKDGTIEFIATDHAPHSKEEKDREFTKAPSGIIGLETSLALGITELVDKGHLSLMELLEKMTINPARFYKLNAGDISKGMPGDIVIFDQNGEWEVSDCASRSDNTPFKGWTLKGKIKYTIAGGKIVYEDK